MKNLLKALTATALLFTMAQAEHKDYFFSNPTSEKAALLSAQAWARNFHNLRIRLIDPPKNEATGTGYYLDKPFFIIDGIHLSTDEARTLSQFQEETEAFDIPKILESLGYTPVLVQFPNTVTTSLQSNSKSFSELLKFLNENTVLPFPNKTEDGFVVLGISQGGIIGRYGSYLYDKNREKNDAPIRFFASLDSPHQGAVLPRSLISSLDFWAKETASGDNENLSPAEAFNDLIAGPGARDLLIYDTRKGNGTYKAKVNSDRFLFGEYRKACDYKGFPVALIAQGQLKGKMPNHNNKYFHLNRSVRKFGGIWARAESELGFSTSDTGEYSFNRTYKFDDFDHNDKQKGSTVFDFVQGSTYPFGKTLYESLRDGIEDAIPDDMNITVGPISVDLNVEWSHDTLYQANSTFIPTASAMDLQCDGDLAIRNTCSFTQSSKDFPFENPKDRSTAKAVYAVDPTHPRYSESISGRHIEPPVSGGEIKQNVLDGMHVDVWRVLCELSKADYDSTTQKFRNAKLLGQFSQNSSCMDQSLMPQIIKNGGVSQQKTFGYARYDFKSSASESNKNVSFNVPAGWQKVAIFDNNHDIPAGAIFEIDVKVDSHKGNWMKSELLLTFTKNGGGQIQMTENNINMDGNTHTLRWQLPTAEGALKRYRWLRLVINSEGGKVTLSNPRLLTSAMTFAAETPKAISSNKIYPNSSISIVPWSKSMSIKDANGILQISNADKFDGMHFDLGGTFSMDKYKNLRIEYVSGTCEGYELFFDSKDSQFDRLVNGSLQNGSVYKILPLSDLINTNVTPNHGLSASRLSLQAIRKDEKCSIKSISLE